MKLNVKRITLIGDINTIVFGNKCCKWLVKNFTSGDIFVSLEDNFKESESIKIAKGMGQVVVANEEYDMESYKTNTIYVKGTGEIEVQQLCFE